MKTQLSNYWFADTTWLRRYAAMRIEAEKNPVEASAYTEMYDRLKAQRESILEMGRDSATIKIHGSVTAEGPDLYDLYYGEPGLSYGELNEALIEAHEELAEGQTLFLDVDTPGGDSSGVEFSSGLIAEIAKERPVVAVVTGMMASAGVWLCSACTEIRASGKTNVIGSVGVATTVVDWSEYYAKHGVKIYDLTNEQSTDKRPDTSTEEGRQVTVDLLGEFYELFIGAVVEGRAGKTTRAKVEKLNGTVVLSEKALETGFIDSVGTSMSNVSNTPAEAGLSEGNGMSLSEYLAQNPEAAKEVEALKLSAKAEGAKEEREAAATRMESVSAYMTEAYDTDVYSACMKAVAGQRSIEAVQDLVAFADKHKASKDSAAGDAEGAELKDTPPADPTKLEGEKNQREIDASNDVLLKAMG
jgi:ClpP class serine protease